MLSYYSTGQFPKTIEQPNKFRARQASKGDAESMYKRNFEDPTQYDFKAGQHALQSEFYHKQYHKINGEYKEKFFATQYNTTQKPQHEEKPHPQQQIREQNLQEPSHLNNWKIVKERKFAERVLQPNPDVEQGKILPKESYKAQSEQASKQPKQWLSRENMFEISKPLIRLDKDLKSQPLIKNVQTVSDDLPKWCLNTNKYYTPENFDLTKKSRKQQLAKADIFGNFVVEPNKDPDNKVYQANPFEGQRFEKSRMCVFYEKPIRVKEKYELSDIKASKVKLNWQEQPEKQRFEPKLPANPGFTQKPAIKEANQKHDYNFDKYDKIGQSEVYKKMDKDKPIQLKIGHGTPSTLNPVKY